MDILKQYDEYLTSNLNEIMVDYNEWYRINYGCGVYDYHKFMYELFIHTIKSFIEHYDKHSNHQTISMNDLKRTFNNNKCVIDLWHGVRECMIDDKLREIDSDFQ